MKFLIFELRKRMKQKKYIWAFLVVFLITSAVFWMNNNQRSKLRGDWAIYRALDDVAVITNEWDKRESDLIKLRDREGLNPMEEKQLKYSREIGLAQQRMRIALSFDMFEEYNRFEQRLLDNLQIYAEAGGEFSVLEGLDREIAIAKNQWKLEHDVVYEYEQAPLSQHLFLTESSSLLLGVLGIAILIVIFGNTITEEREQFTWQTLKTQPLTKGQIIISKYLSTFIMAMIFGLMVIVTGLLVPIYSQGWTLNLMYPQILITGESFMIVSTATYLIRAFILFTCASSIAIAISMMASNWVKSSTGLYFAVGIILSIGYFSTFMIQTPLNPFYLFSFREILNGIPTSSNWMFILSAGVWSGIILWISISLPEKEFQTIQIIKDNKPFAKGVANSFKSLLLKLHIFEWRKVQREGIIKTFFIIILVVIFSGYLFLNNLTQQREQDYIAELNWRIDNRYEAIAANEERKADFLEDLEEFEDAGFTDPWYLSHLEGNIDFLNERIDMHYEYIAKIEHAIGSYEQGDFSGLLEYKLHVNKTTYDAPLFTDIVSAHEKEILIEKDIKPIISAEFIPTIHQLWGRNTRTGWRGEQAWQEEWESQNKKVDNSGLFFLYHSFTRYIYLLPLALLLFFLGGGIAKEKGKQNTLNFLKTQPIPKEKIFLGKLSNSFTLVFVGILIIPLFMILVGTIFNRFGDWNYPILQYQAYSSTLSPDYTGYMAIHGYDFITLGNFLINCTILFVSFSFLVISASNFISLFVKHNLSVWAATTILGFGGYWANIRNPLMRSSISPFTYFNIPKVVNGEVAATINDPRITALRGSIVMLIVAVIIIILGYVMLKRRGRNMV